MSLKLKYTSILGVVVAVVLGLFALSAYRVEKRHLHDALRERVVVLTDYVRASLVTHMLSERAPDFQSFLEGLARSEMEEVRIFSPDGEILASSIPKEVGSKIYPADLARFERNESPRAFLHRKYGRDLYSMVLPLYNEKVCQQCHDPREQVIGVLDTEVLVGEELSAPLKEMRLILGGGYVLSVAAIVMAAAFLTGWIVNRPVEEIIATMRRAQQGDLSVRYRTPRIDEIGRLATNLNLVLASVESAAKEIERYHAERLQRVERLATVGELATTIAHEIKNPLAGISGAVQVLADEIGDDEAKNRVIDEINQQIVRLDKSIRDLQNFARPPDPNLVRVSLNAVLERTLREVNRLVGSASTEITLLADESLPDVELDPDMLQEAVFNVVAYCVRTTSNCESISIASRPGGPGRVEIVVTSSRCSLLPEFGDDVFKPVFSTRSEVGGLGLAISKGILEKHGGSIRLEAGRGDAVSFVMTLPVSQEEEHART